MRRLSGLELHLKRRRSSVIMSTEGMSSNAAPELAILCVCLFSQYKVVGWVGYMRSAS